MTNHVHLLMTPSSIGHIARVMQAFGASLCTLVNDRYRRTGALWEGRYKACMVDGKNHLLRCYHYIELNPVWARMVADVHGYPWSSHASNALACANPLIRPHAPYFVLGTNHHERCEAYREVVEQIVDPEERDHIRLHLQRQHALASDRFRQAIEACLATRADPRRSRKDRQAGKVRLVSRTRPLFCRHTHSE
ncbi:transposase [Dyella monticola]|uniref:transposase n=1 Tax=Dyella monticola TaxID=1927958 RepID=UPI002E7677C4|nr:transposase [Dyella monticola]